MAARAADKQRTCTTYLRTGRDLANDTLPDDCQEVVKQPYFATVSPNARRASGSGRLGPRESRTKGYHSRIKREASASTIPRTPPRHALRAARIRERYREHGKQRPCRTGPVRNRRHAPLRPRVVA